MKKSVLFLVFASMLMFMMPSCSDDPTNLYEQIGNIKKPVIVYDIKLRDANGNYHLVLRGGDNKYYDFEGDDDVIQTIIIRYGVGQELNGFDPLKIDSVKTEDPATLSNKPEDKTNEVKTDESAVKWNNMSYDDRFSLLSYTLYVPDDEAKTLANSNWDKLPDERRVSIDKSFK